MSTTHPTLDPTPDPEAFAHLLASLRTVREAQMAAAQALERLEACRHWHTTGCASLAELGERHGLSAAETALLLRLGQALAARADLREALVEGRVSLESVAALRDVVLDPTLQRPGEDLVAMAPDLPTRQLVRLVRHRVAERREGGPVVEVTVHLSGTDRERLERARQLASRKEERMLSMPEAITRIVNHYLDTFDPLRVRPAARRLPDTRAVPGRAIAAQVKRALELHFGGRCSVAKCEHFVWLHRAHLLAKARGGSQEADNLILLCPRHHAMFDAGEIRIVGTAGKRRFATADGTDLGPLDLPGDGEPPPACGAALAPG